MRTLHQRSAGVLLHFTSLPGPHGIGDFGPEAFHFVDWLVSAGQHVGQLLPMTPIGPGDSPLQSVSAFAGSPLMVALEPGYADERGAGAGLDCNLNVPLPRGTGFARWREALALALDAIARFGADALVVSLGVDTFA